jgi:imidazole glycerol-phosphate synthase subunit HisF
VVNIDVRKNFFGKYIVYVNAGKKSTGKSPEKYAEEMAKLGAGEIMVNSIDNDGIMAGYDLQLVRSVASAVDIPVIACGGAGTLNHFAAAIDSGASAVAAGSMFVYHGPRKGVLINYPERKNIELIFDKAEKE